MNPIKAAAKGVLLFFVGLQAVAASGLATTILDWIDHTPLWLAWAGWAGLGVALAGLLRMYAALNAALEAQRPENTTYSSKEQY